MIIIQDTLNYRGSSSNASLHNVMINSESSLLAAYSKRFSLINSLNQLNSGSAFLSLCQGRACTLDNSASGKRFLPTILMSTRGFFPFSMCMMCSVFKKPRTLVDDTVPAYGYFQQAEVQTHGRACGRTIPSRDPESRQVRSVSPASG